MTTLHVRTFPEDLYRRLQQLAKLRNRSLSAQVVEMLAQGLDEEELKINRNAALSSIHRRRFIPPINSPGSLDLLHEDRNR